MHAGANRERLMVATTRKKVDVHTVRIVKNKSTDRGACFETPMIIEPIWNEDRWNHVGEHISDPRL